MTTCIPLEQRYINYMYVKINIDMCDRVIVVGYNDYPIVQQKLLKTKCEPF